MATLIPAQPSVSVVVPTRNRATSLRTLLDALDAQRGVLLEVIVVDDASTDATLTILEEWQGENRRALRNERASGSYAARNLGWRAARNTIVAFTDDDCMPDTQWAASLIAAFHDPLVVGAQGVTLAEPGTVTPFTHQIDQRRAGPPYRTCNVAYRKPILERLGGFWEMRWYADNIFGLQALQHGCIVFAPQAVVRHPPRAREWRDRHAWLERFDADRVHRRELHRLGIEPFRLPGGVLPPLLWIVRPLIKQSGFHLRYLVRHPVTYWREVRPMVREKWELLVAIRQARRPTVTHERLPALPDLPYISVLVVTRNRPEMLQGLLMALERQTWREREVIVIDHGTDSRTREVVERHDGSWVQVESTITLAAARQAAIDLARGEIAAFTDDDCIPEPDWLRSIATAFRQNPHLWGVQGRTEPERGSIGTRAIRVRGPNRLYQTCNMAYRRDAVWRVGGFDIDFDGWFEDTALGARVLERGPIGFSAGACVLHRAVPWVARDRTEWRRVLRDERRLARRYPSFYHRTRGPNWILVSVARWLVGSPLKLLMGELPRSAQDPRAFLCLAVRHLRERRELLLALHDVRGEQEP